MVQYNTRIKNKRDTSANWTASDPVLLDGEIIIVDTASGGVRKKVGDGVKKYSQLPFDDESTLSTVASKSVNATLTADGWIDNTQALAVTGLGAAQNGTIGLSSGATDEQIDAARNAGLFISAQSEGSLTIKAKDTVPGIDIPITVTMLY